ncbi:lengsin [Rhinatrema bivittatum]|uniref:lengsin n=1 Tax=Rhinatrema bivittatum TaxID=194408 RepID=UPI00112C7C5E|nr:lengsin [Rhinatrema bivittatum]
MTALTRKGADPKNWPPGVEAAFLRLKEAFLQQPCLRHPDPQWPFVIEVDTSSEGKGAVLSQTSKNHKLRPCAFLSHQFSPAEQNYAIGDKELLTIKVALEEWCLCISRILEENSKTYMEKDYPVASEKEMETAEKQPAATVPFNEDTASISKGILPMLRDSFSDDFSILLIDSSYEEEGVYTSRLRNDEVKYSFYSAVPVYLHVNYAETILLLGITEAELELTTPPQEADTSTGDIAMAGIRAPPQTFPFHHKVLQIVSKEWELPEASLRVNRALERLYPLPKDSLELLKTPVVDSAVTAVGGKMDGSYLSGTSGISISPPLRRPSTAPPGNEQEEEKNYVGKANTLKEDIWSSRDRNPSNIGIQKSLHVVSHIEHIKQQIDRENIRFIRFEATDLHGVSRSKTIPAHYFHEKAIHGVCMPRSYLELTLNPKNNEVDHISATNFNNDIVLMPDLSTFRVLPWAEKNARVICDTCTMIGIPLSTSPRHIAKRQIFLLQESGLSLQSAFTYEFCIYGVAEIINSKTISFPAATLLNDHDQPFIQQLIDGMYHIGVNIESFSSSSGPGQMEISFQPVFGLGAADNAFTFRTGIKEVAKKHNYVVSFFTETGFYNSGILSHSLWDINGRKNLFNNDFRDQELTDIGKKWLSGLLLHSAALSCLVAPGVSCRKCFAKQGKDSPEFVYATWGSNDNRCAYNLKCYGWKGIHLENKLASAIANPYLVLAATIAAGLDGIRRGLNILEGTNSTDLYHLKSSAIPLKLEGALAALEEDTSIKEALGEAFIQYFIAMKKYELETEEMDTERNKFLEYFI